MYSSKCITSNLVELRVLINRALEIHPQNRLEEIDSSPSSAKCTDIQLTGRPALMKYVEAHGWKAHILVNREEQMQGSKKLI